MRESCACGAAIQTLSPRRVTTWRDQHRCPDRPAPEPEKDGSFSSTERRAEWDFSGHPIGFTLNAEGTP
jgi:hypothetical protein